MAWTPVANSTIQSEFETVKLRRAQYETALAALVAAQATFTAAQAVADAAAAALNTAVDVMAGDLETFKVE